MTKLIHKPLDIDCSGNYPLGEVSRQKWHVALPESDESVNDQESGGSVFEMKRSDKSTVSEWGVSNRATGTVVPDEKLFGFQKPYDKPVKK